MKRSTFADEQILAMIREAGLAKGGRPGSHPRHHRADLLALEGQVRRDRTERVAAAEAAGRREPPLAGLLQVGLRLLPPQVQLRSARVIRKVCPKIQLSSRPANPLLGHRSLQSLVAVDG
jgi:hypothetical protein